VKPYYEHGGITIYHGESLDILPSIAPCSFDAVVTDPPYLATGSESSWVSRDGAKSLPRETQFYESWLREQMALWQVKLRPTAAIWFTCDWRGAMAAEDAAFRLGMKRPKVGVWHREGLGMGHLLRNVYECFVVLPMPEFERTATDEPDVWVHKWTPGQRKHEHSAEKPVGLMSRAIRLVTKPGGAVLDPFHGSGSVAVACQREGRTCVAIERDEAYCEIAAKRLSQEVLPLEAASA
jgi:site-specific DNA-methyltransferase (adenine-specific)